MLVYFVYGRRRNIEKFGYRLMNIQFMKFRKIALIISGLLLITSLISLTFKNLELGLDFTGGVVRN